MKQVDTKQLMRFSFPQRMDLGECVKVHDLALRADYEIASKEQEYFFELDVSFARTLFHHYTFIGGIN